MKQCSADITSITALGQPRVQPLTGIVKLVRLTTYGNLHWKSSIRSQKTEWFKVTALAIRLKKWLYFKASEELDARAKKRKP